MIAFENDMSFYVSIFTVQNVFLRQKWIVKEIVKVNNTK